MAYVDNDDDSVGPKYVCHNCRANMIRGLTLVNIQLYICCALQLHQVLFMMQENTFNVLTLFILFTASDNRVQHPSWTVVSDSLVKDHTCGGKIFSPHASDCHKYYLCQFGVLIEQTCPSGLYWNKVNCKLIYSKLPVVVVCLLLGDSPVSDL
jgi:hypothetical protein